MFICFREKKEPTVIFLPSPPVITFTQYSISKVYEVSVNSFCYNDIKTLYSHVQFSPISIRNLTQYNAANIIINHLSKGIVLLVSFSVSLKTSFFFVQNEESCVCINDMCKILGNDYLHAILHMINI